MRDIGGGAMAETVGEIIGDKPSEFEEVESALDMPSIDTTPDAPEPGIYFGMPEEEYFAIPAFNTSGARQILSSPTYFWSKSWLNPEKDEPEAKAHQSIGKGYHAMILEGPRAYAERFYPAPDPKDYPKALRGADEIKQAIVERDHKPVAKIEIPDQEGKTRNALKADHVAQLVRIDRSVEVWDDIVAKAERIAAGRTLISADDDRRIKVAARLIMQDPQLAKAFHGGYPEIVLIWRDPRQGVLMKARIDYLKLVLVVDLKSFANQGNRSVRNAIMRAIAEHKYTLQPAVYCQGVRAVRELVKVHGASAIHCPDETPTEEIAKRYEWAMRWAGLDQIEWLWVFQQKGDAPVTRGLIYPLGGSFHTISQTMIVTATRKFRECVESYGTDPWLDLADVDEIEENEIPNWALDI